MADNQDDDEGGDRGGTRMDQKLRARFLARGRIGRYKLDSELGQGGMGWVFLGRDEEDRPVAIKMIRDTLLEAEPRRRDLAELRFEREATIDVDHPNVIRNLDQGVTADLRNPLVFGT